MNASVCCLKLLPLCHSTGALSVASPDVGENTSIAQTPPPEENPPSS